MNNPVKAITGMSAAGLFVLFGLHGSAFFKSAGNALDFLVAISAKAPLGLASFFASVAASTILWLALQRWIPETRNRWSRSFAIDVIAAGAGAWAAYMQQPTSNGLLWGVLAGFIATYPARGLMALATWVGHLLEDRPEPKL